MVGTERSYLHLTKAVEKLIEMGGGGQKALMGKVRGVATAISRPNSMIFLDIFRERLLTFPRFPLIFLSLPSRGVGFRRALNSFFAVHTFGFIKLHFEMTAQNKMS